MPREEIHIDPQYIESIWVHAEDMDVWIVKITFSILDCLDRLDRLDGTPGPESPDWSRLVQASQPQWVSNAVAKVLRFSWFGHLGEKEEAPTWKQNSLK